jgi:hypothetical protein
MESIETLMPDLNFGRLKKHKGMNKKTKIEPDNKEQFARFVEAAKKIENPDAKEAFEDALDKIIKGKKPAKK